MPNCKPILIGPHNLTECMVCGQRFQVVEPVDQIVWECTGVQRLYPGYIPSEYKRPAGVPVTTRNLCFHLMPDRRGQWRWHAEKLKHYFHIFNGRKSLGIVTGPGLASVDDVLCDMPEFDYTFVTVNNPEVREGATLGHLLDSQFSLDPTEITFYCHSKGCRYPPDHVVWTWAKYMYSMCLDDVDRIHNVMGQSPCCGSLKVTGQRFNSQKYLGWHYSGSFFWFHNASLFSFPNWGDIEHIWYVVEPYLSKFFTSAEAYNLSDMLANNELLYDKSFWLSRGGSETSPDGPMGIMAPVPSLTPVSG